jgi:hypothetical protein
MRKPFRLQIPIANSVVRTKDSRTEPPQGNSGFIFLRCEPFLWAVACPCGPRLPWPGCPPGALSTFLDGFITRAVFGPPTPRKRFLQRFLPGPNPTSGLSASLMSNIGKACERNNPVKPVGLSFYSMLCFLGINSLVTLGSAFSPAPRKRNSLGHVRNRCASAAVHSPEKPSS